MTTLMPLLSVTGLVLLLLTAAPTSCNSLTPGSHLAPFSRGEVKDEDTSAPGVVIDNVVDVKAEGFVEKDTKADELTESALRDDVLQILKTTGLNADSHDGLPPLQSVERGSSVTSSRAARRRRNANQCRPFQATFTPSYTSPPRGVRTIRHYCKSHDYERARRDFDCLCRSCGNRGRVGGYSVSLRRDSSNRGLIIMQNDFEENHYHYCFQSPCSEGNCQLSLQHS